MHSVAMKKSSSIGFIAGILGAMCFGLIPVFSKPALALGLSPACILTYRFFIGSHHAGNILGDAWHEPKTGKMLFTRHDAFDIVLLRVGWLLDAWV